MSVTPTAIARDGWGTSLTATPRLERARHHGHRSQRRVERRHVGHDLAQLRRPSTTYDYANQDPINAYDLSGELPVPPNPCVTQHQCGGSIFSGAVHFVATHKLEVGVGVAMVAAAFVAPELEPVIASGLARAVVASRVPAAFAAAFGGTKIASDASAIYNRLPAGMSVRDKVATTVALLAKPNVVRAARAAAKILQSVRRVGH
jgi:hypothetical protein